MNLPLLRENRHIYPGLIEVCVNENSVECENIHKPKILMLMGVDLLYYVANPYNGASDVQTVVDYMSLWFLNQALDILSSAPELTSPYRKFARSLVSYGCDEV